MDGKSVGVNSYKYVVSKISGFLLTWPIKQMGREIALTYYLITIFKMVYCIGGDLHLLQLCCVIFSIFCLLYT